VDSPNQPRHVLVFNYIFELPFGKGRRFLDHGGVVDKVLGGWQISAIHRYQSGLPLVVSYNNGGAVAFLNAVGYQGNLRPNLTGQEIFTGNEAGGLGFQLINPAAFAAPVRFDQGPALVVSGALNPNYVSYYTDPNRFFGNAPPVLGDARSLPFYSENMSLLKKTRITERVTFEVRGEVFNIFNRHRYRGPQGNLDAGDFGFSGVEGDPNAYPARTIQVGARLIF
jgi:hypothetical protein